MKWIKDQKHPYWYTQVLFRNYKIGEFSERKILEVQVPDFARGRNWKVTLKAITDHELRKITITYKDPLYFQNQTKAEQCASQVFVDFVQHVTLASQPVSLNERRFDV